MEQAKSILPRLFEQGQGTLRPVDLIRAGWRSTVGPAIAERSRPVRLDRGTLVVDVLDPAWIVLLKPMSAQILRLLRRQWPQAGVARIAYRPRDFEAGRAARDHENHA